MGNNTIIYYDESEHSRMINQRTLESQNYYDNFIGSYIKVSDKNLLDFEKAYSSFEKKYEQRSGGGELKSTTIKNKQLKFGFASSNKDTLIFISDFLDVIKNTNTEVLVTLTSKIDYLANQILVNYKNSIMMDADAIRYTFAKSIDQYKPADVIEAIENQDDSLIEKLITFYEELIEKNKENLTLKEKENAAFEQLLVILFDVNTDIKLQWEYDTTFECVNKLMIPNQDTNLLVLDEEGTGRSIESALRAGIKNVIEDNSMNLLGLRCADMMAGVITKLLKAIHNDINDFSYYEKMERKTLSANYFDLNQEQYQLYMKLARLSTGKKINLIATGFFKDSLLELETLLNYISSYTTFSEFQKKDKSEHEYLFDIALMNAIGRYLEMMHNKLPFTEVDLSKEFFIGNSGQKIYKDINKHQYLDLTQEKQTYYVLNVGITNEGQPTITVKVNECIECFRLPNQMSDWVLTCIGFANAGNNLFPSNTLFTKINDEIFVDVL